MRKIGKNWMAAVAVMLLSVVCAAQMPSQHGSVPASNRMDFGAACGLSDSSPERALRLERLSGQEWKRIEGGQRPNGQATGLARIWHEVTWMVDMHDAPVQLSQFSRMHTAQMCFSPSGRIVKLIDRFMDMQGCGCMRFTALEFDEPTGRVGRREQHFLSLSTGQEMAAPEKTDGFPAVFDFRRLEQLPFFPLVQR